MANAPKHDPNDESHQVVKTWFYVTMVTTVLFVAAVFIFII